MKSLRFSFKVLEGGAFTMKVTKLKPDLEKKLKRLRDIRNNMIGKRKKRIDTLPKYWYEFHKSNR